MITEANNYQLSQPVGIIQDKAFLLTANAAWNSEVVGPIPTVNGAIKQYGTESGAPIQVDP